MARSSWKNIAVERDEDETMKEDSPAPKGVGVVISGCDGLVMLDPYKPSASVETPDARRVGARGRVLRGRRSNKIGEQIGEHLRGLYDDVLSQPVPDRFLELLNKLEMGPISPSARTKAPGER